MSMTVATHRTDVAGSTSPGPTIELVGVSKNFGNLNVLHDISLAVADGEFLVLLGPSGCGKSTILRLISGLEDANKGEIYINGDLANYLMPKERNVAMVFQNYALYPHMTVERNIGFPLEMGGIRLAERRPRVAEIARMLDIEDQLEKYPEQLSGGQRQRVALGRALIRNPVAYLFDEPLSNLDAILRVQMREELLKVHRRIGRTTLYVTHDQVEAMTMADRIVILKGGIIQQIGRPREIYMQPANVFVATFVGSPQMNVFEGTLVHSEDGPKFTGPFTVPVSENLKSIADGTAISVGIRPEDVTVLQESALDSVGGQVIFVEPVGSDTYLSVEVAAGVAVKVRVPAAKQFEEGDAVHLRLVSKNMHFFGADGQRIEF